MRVSRISSYGDSGWSLATKSCEPRQARKGAAAAVSSGAEDPLAGLPPSFVVLFEFARLYNTRVIF